MPPIRFRMNRLMACILIIALNLAGLRALILGNDFLPIWVILGGLLQFAAYRGFRRPGRARSFWLGFASIGTIGAVSLYWGIHDEESIAARLWIPYAQGMSEFVGSLQARIIERVGHKELARAFVLALICIGAILPVVLLAYAGGILIRRIQGDPGRRSDASEETLVL